jgi:hypothetical protein
MNKEAWEVIGTVMGLVSVTLSSLLLSFFSSGRFWFIPGTIGWGHEQRSLGGP